MSANSYLTGEQLKELNEKQIISLNQPTEELNKRKTEQSSSSFQARTHELKNNLAKDENCLNSFQASNTTANNDKSSNVDGVIVAIAGISTLAIVGISLVKSKFGKKK